MGFGITLALADGVGEGVGDAVGRGGATTTAAVACGASTQAIAPAPRTEPAPVRAVMMRTRDLPEARLAALARLRPAVGSSTCAPPRPVSAQSAPKA